MTKFANYLEKNEISLNTEIFLIPISPEAESARKSPLFYDRTCNYFENIYDRINASPIGGQAYIFEYQLDQHEKTKHNDTTKNYYRLFVRLLESESRESDFLDICFEENPR